MKNLWNDAEAAAFSGDLQQRVYSSRLLGRDASLVLHGGGNTSVKSRIKNIFGEEEDILFVKGSGWDLISIEPEGFSPVRLKPLERLATLPALSDPDMAREMAALMTRPGAPAPSVEAILHACLPFRFVDHTHADSIVTITNTENGEAWIREIYGDDVVVIPYVMPGFDLAKLCAELFPKHRTPRTIGMVLLNHGLFSFGDTAKESYERTIRLVQRAEDFLASKGAWSLETPPPSPVAASTRGTLSRFRADTSKAAGRPMILRLDDSDKARAFAQHKDAARISQRGPATPDHVLRTKRTPMLGRAIAAFVTEYQQYFAAHSTKAKDPKTMLDPAPRVVLDPEWGLVTIGKTASDALIAGEIYDHTIDIIRRATALGGWKALDASHIFDVEYWDLEQAKLKKAGGGAEFTGEVALVTGAASGIGRATVEMLLKRGAAVIGVDIDPKIQSLFKPPAFTGLVCDLTNEKQIDAMITVAERAYGGVDLLVLNAGAFPKSTPVAGLASETWASVMSLNVESNLTLLRELHPMLRAAPGGGRVAVVGSKNVAAPGPGASAYSASKAALTQLARVIALEWAPDGIRVNTVHPDAVFDTGLWEGGVLESRAKSYGLSVEDYKRKNLLKTEILSRDVAELIGALLGKPFAKTTGAQVPIDGGNDRVI